jgi:hypothetical protein
MKYCIYVAFIFFAFAGCTKELSQEGGVYKEPPVSPDTVPVIKYQLKAFYSDIPIDWDEADNNHNKETDLWAYVQEYIKDDYNILLGSDSLVVYQNNKKMPGLADPILYKTYSFETEGTTRYMNFLTPEYAPARYRLYEMTDDHFIIGLKWKDGAHVFSRFERVP